MHAATCPTFPVVRWLVAVCCASALLRSASADQLFSNGPLITNPTGGTGSIAGQPISQSDGFTVPGSSFVFSTLGVGATIPVTTAVAEDFVVPPGGWDLDAVTLYAFQTGQTTPTVTTIEINLWTAAPFSADSPPPLPDPLPQPLLAQPLSLSAGTGVFVCHRQSPSSTSTVRPVYAYTVSLDDLPDGGILNPGEYWLQWSFQGASSPSQNVFTPLVTPRTSAANLNARLLNSIDGSAGGPRVWFEGREGFVSGVSEGRPYAIVFELHGTPIAPIPGDLNCDGVANILDINPFVLALSDPAAYATAFPYCDPGVGDLNNDGEVDILDINPFIAAISGG